MAVVHFNQRLIFAKVVYVGAEGAGSNTTVRALHGLAPTPKGDLLVFGAPDDEVSYLFEHAGVTSPKGFALRFRVYSLPGGVESVAHRDLVLRDVDAIVLVLDARPDRGPANRAALDAITTRLSDHGRSVARVPIVVQVNHGDHRDVRPMDAVVADLGMASAPIFRSIARSAEGISDAHGAIQRAVTERVIANLEGDREAIALELADGPPPTDEDVVADHIATLTLAQNPASSFIGTGARDLTVGLGKRYASLPAGPRVEAPFQPREFVGMRPVHVLDAHIEVDGVHVDLVMERLSGGEPRRLSVGLVNRPVDATPAQRPTSSPTARPITSDLPDKVEFDPPAPMDFPPVWYGIAGVAGGMVVGVMIGYLAFA